MPTQKAHTTCEEQPRDFFKKHNQHKKDQCENNTTKRNKLFKLKKNLVKKNETSASFYSFPIILNPKQRLCFARWWLLFRNRKMEDFEN
jgi:hypothetical protein